MSRGGAGWRDEAAAALAAGSLPYLELGGPVLVMEDHRPEVCDRLEDLGLSRQRWVRRAFGGADASPWPPDGPFGAVLIRLSRAREEQEMTLHAALTRLRPGGRLVAYGANDEGARSVVASLEPLVGSVHTVATGSRCRVLSATRPAEVYGLLGGLGDWRREGPAPVPELGDSWVSWPGIFAHGRLDEGTALLLEHLPRLSPGSTVLDFACGTGVVGAVARARGEGIQVEFLDADALALRAVEENVQEAVTLLGDGLAPARARRYDAILTNPPYHQGKGETLRVLRELAEGAPGVLRPGGVLTMVAQRRLPTEELLRKSFGGARVVADRGLYRVWEARRG